MRKTEVVKKEIPVTIVTCDFCGEGDKHRICTGIKLCKVCGRDVCWDCAIACDFYDCDLLNPNFWGDHPEYVCKECWEKGQFIRNKIMKSRNLADEAESKLIESWRKLCKR